MSEDIDCADDTLDAGAPAISDPIHILIVEDMKEFARWIAQHLSPLKEAFPRARITIVHTWSEAWKVLDQKPAPDATLLDLGLPDSLIHETIARVAIVEERSPVVIITGANIKEVENALVDKRIEVLEKSSTLGNTDAIIRSIVRAMMRKEKFDSDARIERNRSLLLELKARGYGTTPEPA